MNARNSFAELKRRNVSESSADDLAGGTKQRPPDRLGVVPMSEFRIQRSVKLWREVLLECNASSHRFEARSLEVFHNRVLTTDL